LKELSCFLEQYRSIDLLRIATAGSVDDGKSTLIGRLLCDSKSIFEDQLASVRDYSEKNREIEVDYSLITDGLKAEREQGITIDVAYRFFSTPKRRFIVADTPGHEQYTRNMATGASTASLSLILIDATKGVVTQTRRHTFISSLLGVRHFIVAVNKMDLVGYSEEVFQDIVEKFKDFSDKLPIESIQFIPLSALHGDNVMNQSGHMTWYRGPALFDYLESVSISDRRNLVDFRFPVQYTIWSGTGFRGYCGTVASGIIRPGEMIKVLPSGKVSRVSRIVTFDGDLSHAYASQAVCLSLENDLDIERGDILVREHNLPLSVTGMEANIVWMDESPLKPGRTFLLKHSSRTEVCTIERIRYRFDLTSLHRLPADEVRMNEIAKVGIKVQKPIFADLYDQNSQTGSFILINKGTNQTSGAGMITRDISESNDITNICLSGSEARNIVWVYGKDSELKCQEKADELTLLREKFLVIDEKTILSSEIPVLHQRDSDYYDWVAYTCNLIARSGASVLFRAQSAPPDIVKDILGDRLIEIC